MASSKLSTEDEPLKDEADQPVEDAEEVVEEVAEPVEEDIAADTDEERSEELEKPAQDPAAETPEPVTEAEEKQSVFFPALMGGLLAAGVGFGVASYVGFGPGAQNAELIAAQADRIAALEDSVSTYGTTLSSAIEQSTTDQNRQDGALSDVNDALTGLVARLDAIEASALEGDGISEATLGALRDDIAAVNTALSGQAGQIEAIIAANSAEATQTADALAAQAALSQIRAALAGGGNFASSVDELDRLNITVPDSLRASVDGVATQAGLAEGFSAPARAALDMALQQSADDGTASRVTVFLRRQTGLRSLTPSEGNDPDAVLSRAEAALVEGDYANTVQEIALLPETAQNAFADWLTELHTRTAALQGVEILSQTLSGN
ncbi:COG4223 family protein [Cochlodiniinecator piscidefendens]|uniref:COG4223 family protein n=1 Tax=Cochlodiniinecator piscidefendens TaxID=2715756 RepID=UPI00140AECAE|nr:hypothetical protein [Cochlodiniinecator piscidefendens]